MFSNTQKSLRRLVLNTDFISFYHEQSKFYSSKQYKVKLISVYTSIQDLFSKPYFQKDMNIQILSAYFLSQPGNSRAVWRQTSHLGNLRTFDSPRLMVSIQKCGGVIICYSHQGQEGQTLQNSGRELEALKTS